MLFVACAAVTKETIQAKVIINCAGLYGDAVEKLIDPSTDPSSSESPKFTVTPRKGQFVVYQLAESANDVRGQYSSDVIIEPVATQFTKGVIVWKTLYGNVVVGPTATNVSSPEDYGTDIETLSRLQQFGEKVLPCLKNAKVLGSYSGLRPATEHRDYQIYASRTPEGALWITVGGIRSTGR